VYYNRQRHVQEAYRQLGLALGVDAEVGRPASPHVSDAERQSVRARLGQWGSGGRRLLLVNPNAGDLCLERRWLPERFARLAAHFSARQDLAVVLTGSPAEAEYTESVRQMITPELRPRVMNAAGALDFGEFLALIERADVLVTGDSGPLHLAVALGTPTVSVFGPCAPEAYRPLEGHHRVLSSSVYCSPCLHWVDEPPCAGENLCMQRIGWHEVAAATAELLGLPPPDGDAGEEASAPGPVAGYAVRKSVAREAAAGGGTASRGE